MLSLLTREPRTQAPAAVPVMEPFRTMRDLLHWDPFREHSWFPEANASFLPSFDVKETPDAYVFKADLPGFKLENLELQTLGNRISIRGSREAEEKEDQDTWHLMERGYGAFSRSFNLPENVKTQEVDAHLEGGVLTLSVAKSPAVKPQKVKIQSR